jgi:hypothetical protein
MIATIKMRRIARSCVVSIATGQRPIRKKSE